MSGICQDWMPRASLAAIVYHVGNGDHDGDRARIRKRESHNWPRLLESKSQRAARNLIRRQEQKQMLRLFKTF